MGLGGGTEIKTLELFDCVPPEDLRSEGRVVLMGDALHPMTMCKSETPTLSNTTPWSPPLRNSKAPLTPADRGEGANHAIVDVADFAQHVVPALLPRADRPDITTPAGLPDLRAALDAYEETMVKRTRLGVLASRRACLDAHEWGRINAESPLLTRRAMNLDIEYEC